MEERSPGAGRLVGFVHRLLEHLGAAKGQAALLRRRLRRGALSPAESEARLAEIERQIDAAVAVAEEAGQQASSAP